MIREATISPPGIRGYRVTYLADGGLVFQRPSLGQAPRKVWVLARL